MGEFDQGEVEAFAIGIGDASKSAFLITVVIGNAVPRDKPGHSQAPDLKRHQLSWKKSVN